MKTKTANKNPQTVSHSQVSKGKTSQPSAAAQRFIALAVALLVGAAGLYTLLSSRAAATTPTLYLTPASQTVITGSDITVSVMVDSAGASINTVQTILTYSATNFSFVSITPDPAFSAAFPTSNVPGSIQFTAGSTTPVVGIQKVATVTLRATGVGTSPLSFAAVCPPNDFSPTCSAVYATTTGAPNVLTTVTNGSFTVNPILPTVPANLRSTGKTTTSISLAWDASTDVGGPGVAGYKLYRGGTLIATQSGTTFTDTGRTPGTPYSYTVASYDLSIPAYNSAQSAPLSVTTVALPTTPTNLRSTSTMPTTITLVWNASTDVGGPGLAGYKLFRDGVLIASPTGTTYTDSGLTPSKQYNYTIAAVDVQSNSSTISAPVSITTAALPTVPANFQSTSSTTNSISLSWSASTAAGGVGGYKLYRGGNLIATLSAATTLYQDVGLTPNTTYSYTISAFDTANPPNSSALSAPLSAATKAVTADLDGDAHVTAHDLSLLLAKFNTTYPEYDIDGVPPISAHDLSLLLGKFGT